SGLELARALRGGEARVVLVTAYAEHAALAFELEAFDYLLKPVQPERLARCLERLREALPGGARFVRLRQAGGAQLLPLAEVALIRAQGAYSEVLTAGGAALTEARNLAAWQRLLPADRFLRVHRSCLLARASIRRVERGAGGRCSVVAAVG